MTMDIMADIKEFPYDRNSRSESERRLSFGFSIIAVVFSVFIAAIIGTWITGQTTAATATRIDALVNQTKDHDAILSKEVDRLVVLINSFGVQIAAQGAQIEGLRQALGQEREDRIQYERNGRR